MNIPQPVLSKVYQHYDADNWCIITLDIDDVIIECNAAAKQMWQLAEHQTNIKSVIPLLATESLKEDFFIPFYNHETKVFDVHFMVETHKKFIFMIPTGKVHQQLQQKQQAAHEQAIEKLRLQYLFSALESAHDELKTANQVKSFYISALSHEIGNPLNVIKGYNQLICEGSIDINQASQVINRNINKLERIISQSIDYDREQTKQYSALFKPAELVSEQFNDFRIQANSKNISLNNQVDPDVTLASNKTKWNQILTNLISNAIKYTDTGQVTVVSTLTDGQLYIDVADTGCGMSEEFQQNLFTAWSREQKSQAHGNGIGLVISRMLAEQVNGQLTLLSSDSGGSCFRFSTPYKTPQKSQKILLVDDDQDCLSLFKYYLTEAGHHVKTTDCITGLKQQLNAHQFDVLITDLNLTDGQVHQAYAEYNQLVTRIIIMTASLTNEMHQKLKAMGVEKILSKPLTQEQLINSVI